MFILKNSKFYHLFGEKKAGKIIASVDKRYFLGARMKNIFENKNIFYGDKRIIYGDE